MTDDDVSRTGGTRRESVVRDSLGPFAVANAPTVEATASQGTPTVSAFDGNESSEGGGKRDKALVIRVTAAELELLHAAARSQGRGKTAGWARDVLLEHAGAKETHGERESPVVNAARGELVRMGNNLNQIARALNMAVKGSQVLPAREALEVLSQVRRDLAATRVLLRDGVTQRLNGGVS